MCSSDLADSLITIIDALPEGTTELACHPGLDAGVDSMYAAERPLEVQALCDPRVRDALAARGVVLATFRDVAERLEEA